MGAGSNNPSVQISVSSYQADLGSMQHIQIPPSRLIDRERGRAKIIHVGCKHLTLHNEHVEGHHSHFPSRLLCTAGRQTVPRAYRWASPPDGD